MHRRGPGRHGEGVRRRRRPDGAAGDAAGGPGDPAGDQPDRGGAGPDGRHDDAAGRQPGGADAGSVVKPRDEQWSAERIAITTGLVVIALAAIGYVFGKIRSVPPKHPDLVATRDDLELMG